MRVHERAYILATGWCASLFCEFPFASPLEIQKSSSSKVEAGAGAARRQSPLRRKFPSLQLRTELTTMGLQRKAPTLEPVLENYMGPSMTTQPRVRYKAQYRDSTEVREDASARAQCMCVMKPWNFFGKLRDRYIKAMNEMAMGGDFTAMAGYHGTLGSQECRYAMERCRSVKERQQEALQEELAALSRSQSQEPHRSFVLRKTKV